MIWRPGCRASVGGRLGSWLECRLGVAIGIFVVPFRDLAAALSCAGARIFPHGHAGAHIMWCSCRVMREALAAAAATAPGARGLEGGLAGATSTCTLIGQQASTPLQVRRMLLPPTS